MGIFGLLFRRTDVDPPSVESFDDEVEDYEDMIPEEPADPDFHLAGMRLGMIYKDYHGAKSKRIVRLKRLDAADGYGTLTAFCELRQQDRTFNIDSIQAIFDPATGEALPPPQDFFGPFIDAQVEAADLAYERRRFYSVWPVIEALRHELQVLVLVARAEGRFVKAEQNILLRYVQERASELSLTIDDAGLSVLRGWLQLQDPSEPEARIAIKELAASPGGLEAIWEMSEIVAAADGKIREDEKQSILEIRDTINRVAGLQ